MIDGPFAETKELIAGFWIWQVKSHGRGDRVGQALPQPDGRASPRSRSARSSRPRTSATSSRPSCASRRSGCARRSRRQSTSCAIGGRVTACRADTHRAIDAVWRIESARLIAGLARIVRDVGLAEELAQDALVAALEQWPESGVPDNPGAWLMATAKHRAIDRLRREQAARAQARGARPRARGAAGDGRAGSRRRARRRHRRRPAAPDLHRLPSGALDRGARRAHAAPARRPDHRRDRARVPRPGADHRPAHRARQAHAGRGAGAVRGARAATSCADAAGVGARGHLPDLQRGLLGDRRRRLDAAGAVRGRAAPRPHPGRAGARASRRCTAWSR